MSKNLREEVSITKFKKGAKKWVTEQIPVRPGREEDKGIASDPVIDSSARTISMKKKGYLV